LKFVGVTPSLQYIGEVKDDESNLIVFTLMDRYDITLKEYVKSNPDKRKHDMGLCHEKLLEMVSNGFCDVDFRLDNVMINLEQPDK
jgi:hypothetical protein